MGNNSNKNDDFSKNPNFNMHQHQQNMQNLAQNYRPAAFNMPHRPVNIPAPI